MKRTLSLFLSAAAMIPMLAVSAHAADYSISTAAPQGYYGGTSYEDVYGSQYNYGGANMADYQDAVLLYGNSSTTQAGVMEKFPLPGLQAVMGGVGESGYGLSGDMAPVLPQGGATIPSVSVPTYVQPAYTSVEGMAYKDGSIGTVKIPSLGINMKVWEGETASSMRKGLGHYTSTSAWNGNVAVCGHNRGAQYVIGSIKDLKQGDTITYTTVYGTRTYQVVTVQIIANTDWSCLQATADNRITLTTCLANHPESRVCVQAVEKS